MNLRRIIIKLTAILTIVVLSSFNVLAASVDYPENFMDFTPQQCIDWIDANIEPIIAQGTLVSVSRNIVKDYTWGRENYAYDESGAKLVGIRMGYYWRVNLDSTIESYGISEHTPLIFSDYYTFLNKDVTSYYLFPGNVKICPEVTFASAYNGILVGQNVNLHSSGQVSFIPVDYTI